MLLNHPVFNVYSLLQVVQSIFMRCQKSQTENHFISSKRLHVAVGRVPSGNTVLGDPEVTANLYCDFAYPFMEGCGICSIYLRYFLGHPVGRLYRDSVTKTNFDKREYLTYLM